MGSKLTAYKGHDVLSATVSIRNTGSGLEEAMAVDPVELELQSTVHIVLECEVEKHRYDPIKETNAYQLVNMLKAGRATIVDAEVVEKFLDDQEQRIAEAEGEPMIEFPDEDDEDTVVSPTFPDPPEDEEPADGFGLADLSDEDD